MIGYSFREGDKILQNLIIADDKENRYFLSNHLKERADLRKINVNYIRKMLLTKEPLGVL